ncbi:MAG: hypothetical protein KBE42_13585 [Steroidobacteraceae bacterium]|nr:hypothetical protein [Steroidobacteraceae bacterium]
MKVFVQCTDRLRLRRGASCAAALVLACALTAACGDGAGHRQSRSGIEFGVWVAEAGGELKFMATSEVPYVENQPFGWRVKGGSPAAPVKWVETIHLPAAPQSWEGVADSTNITISEDGRSATTFGQSLPIDEFVGNVWYVSVGDPTGACEMSVELEDGRKASFRFRIVQSPGGLSDLSGGEVI